MPASAVAGSGGTISTYASGAVSYTVHSFTTTGSDTFTVPTGVTSVDYLIVGGGGGGGAAWIDQSGGSGGGGGQVLTGTATVTPEQDYAVTVGAGGAGGLLSLTPSITPESGANGESSSAFGQSAGGGYGAIKSFNGFASPGTGKAGNSGGNVFTGANSVKNSWCHRGGGGAGAGENGYVGQYVSSGASDISTTGSKGGAGVASDIRTGASTYYGGGGGGAGTGNCAQSGTGAGSGGAGGGGNSATWNGRGVSGTCCSGYDGAANTGGGGGGQSGYRGQGGNGGSGLVVVRYVTPQVVTWSPTIAVRTIDSPVTPSATASSSAGAAISYSVVSNTTATCSVNSSTGELTYTGAGTCTVRATAAGSGQMAAASKDVVFTVSRAAQSALTVASSSGTFGTQVTLSSSGGSGTGAVTYSVSGTGTADGCAVDGTSLSVTSAGTCKITATKASDVNYLSATSAEATITFGKAGQPELTVTSTSGTVGEPLPIVVTGGNGTGLLSYELQDGGTTTCTISAGSLLAGSLGTCVVKVTKGADSSWDAQSTTATISFVAQTTATIATAETAPQQSGGTGGGETVARAATAAATATTVAQTTTTVQTQFAEAAPTVADVDPGAGALELDGELIEATTTRADNELTVSAAGYSVTIAAVDDAGNVKPLSADGSVLVEPNDRLRISGTGFAEGTNVDVWMFSTPTLLGNVEVSANGSLSATYRVPDDAERGEHRISLVGKDSDGGDSRFTVGIVVGGSEPLSTTAKVLIAIPIAGAIAFGLILPTTIRRRRRNEAIA
ncbi:MAG: hypothetical protein RLY50_1351 [Actinomycetota bacterium]